MCGISGIINFSPDEAVERERLLAMRDSLWHRGPDDGGEIIEAGAGLAHRRLSIIDLGGGHQPMPNRDRSLWITYNGELYNYRELRAELQRSGCHFETRSDTEVLLRAYEVYGEDCVHRLRGMFAFAIWDTRRRRLFMARDRLGIKPLYYHAGASRLLFGSEIKAILASGLVQAEFNSAVLPEFLATRYVSGEETFYRGVSKLLPGHSLSWSPEEGLRVARYWHPPATREDDSMSRADYVEMIRAGIDDAVRSHLVSDVPVGLFLSGGIDSSALAGFMAPMVDGPIHTFSVGFSERGANELEYARLAAQSVGARHRDVQLSADDFFAALPHLIWHEDEPIAFTSSVPLHVISRLASEDLKVVLTGEGADELFLGYDYRYRVTAWNRRLGARYEKAAPAAMRKAVAGAVPRLPARLRRYAERTFLALDSDPRSLFFENFSVFGSALRNSLLRGEGGDPFERPMALYREAGDEPLQCMSHTDMQTYMVELLMKQDQMSMSASLESRVPFLDHHLVEKVAEIPGPRKMRGWQTKALMREAVRDKVPEAILKRGKMGFPVPTSQWLRERYWPVVEEFVLSSRSQARGYFDPQVLRRIAHEHREGARDHGERLWLLINLEIWQRIFIDGEEPAAVYGGGKRAAADAVGKGYRPVAAVG